MKIKGKICETGGKRLSNGRCVNEDGVINFATKHNDIIYNFVILMDGATGLGKDYQIAEGFTSAEWYVNYIMDIMKEKLMQSPTCNLEDVIESSILKAIDKISEYEKESGIKLEEYQKPSASLSLLKTNGDITEIYIIGDTQTLVAYKDGRVILPDNPNQKAVQKLDNSVLNRMVELAKERNCNVIDTRTDEEIEKMLQVNRFKKNNNCEDGYWVCGTTLGIVKKGVHMILNNEEIAGIILSTDGFDFSVLNLDEKSIYKLIVEKGVNAVADLIRKKQEQDPMCNEFPRFKKSDDLTAIHLDYLTNEENF